MQQKTKIKKETVRSLFLVFNFLPMSVEKTISGQSELGSPMEQARGEKNEVVDNSHNKLSFLRSHLNFFGERVKNLIRKTWKPATALTASAFGLSANEESNTPQLPDNPWRNLPRHEEAMNPADYLTMNQRMQINGIMGADGEYNTPYRMNEDVSEGEDEGTGPVPKLEFKEVESPLEEGGNVEIGEMVKSLEIEVTGEIQGPDGEMFPISISMDALQFARSVDDLQAKLSIGENIWTLTVSLVDGTCKVEGEREFILEEKDLESIEDFDAQNVHDALRIIFEHLKSKGFQSNPEALKTVMKALTGRWQNMADRFASNYAANGGNQLLSTPDGSDILGILNLTGEIEAGSDVDGAEVATATGLAGLTFDTETNEWKFGNGHKLLRPNMLEDGNPIQTPQQVAHWGYDKYGIDTRAAIDHPYGWLNYNEDDDGYPYRGTTIPRDNGARNGGDLKSQVEVEADMAAQDAVIDATRNAEMDSYLSSIIAGGNHFFLSADNYDSGTGELSYRGQVVSRDKAPDADTDAIKSQAEIELELAAIDSNIDSAWAITMNAWADAINADAVYGVVMHAEYVVGAVQNERYLRVLDPISGEELLRLDRDDASGIPVLDENAKNAWADERYTEANQEIIDWANNMLSSLYSLGYDNDPLNPDSIIFEDMKFKYRDSRGYRPGVPADPYYADHYLNWNKPGVTPLEEITLQEVLAKRVTIEARIDNAGATAEIAILAHPSVPSTPDCDFDAVGYDSASNSFFFLDNASQAHVWAFSDIHQMDGLDNPQINAAALFAIDQVIAANREVAITAITAAFPANVEQVAGFSVEESNLRFAVTGGEDNTYNFLGVANLDFFLENAVSVKEWAKTLLLAVDQWGNWDGDGTLNQFEVNSGTDPFLNEESKTNNSAGFDPTSLSSNGIVSLIDFLQNSPAVTLDETTKNDWIISLQTELSSRQNSRSSSEGFRMDFENADQLFSILSSWNNLSNDEFAQRNMEWKGMLNILNHLKEIDSPYHGELRKELEQKVRKFI